MTNPARDEIGRANAACLIYMTLPLTFNTFKFGCPAIPAASFCVPSNPILLLLISSSTSASFFLRNRPSATQPRRDKPFQDILKCFRQSFDLKGNSQISFHQKWKGKKEKRERKREGREDREGRRGANEQKRERASHNRKPWSKGKNKLTNSSNVMPRSGIELGTTGVTDLRSHRPATLSLYCGNIIRQKELLLELVPCQQHL